MNLLIVVLLEVNMNVNVNVNMEVQKLGGLESWRFLILFAFVLFVCHIFGIFRLTTGLNRLIIGFNNLLVGCASS